MKNNFIILLVLLSVQSLSKAQTNSFFTSQRFFHFLDGTKDAIVTDTSATISKKTKDYSRLILSNKSFNNKPPIGDFKVNYEFNFDKENKKAEIGMLFFTDNAETNQSFAFAFMLSASGMLRFYSGEFLSNWNIVPEDEFTAENCKSIKPNFIQNNVSIERSGRNWLLIINTDTIKNIEEMAYGSNKTQKKHPSHLATRPYGNSIDLIGNNILIKGKQTVVFTNYEIQLFELESETIQNDLFFATMSGKFITEPLADENNKNVRIEVHVKYYKKGNKDIASISFLDNESKDYELTLQDGKWNCFSGQNDNIVIDGKEYHIAYINFNRINDLDVEINYYITRQELNYTTNTKTTTNVAFFGIRSSIKK